MTERIARPPARIAARPGRPWRRRCELVGALTGLDTGDVVVVDCLTLWLSNLMLDDRDLAAAAAELVVAA